MAAAPLSLICGTLNFAGVASVAYPLALPAHSINHLFAARSPHSPIIHCTAADVASVGIIFSSDLSSVAAARFPHVSSTALPFPPS